MSDSAGSMVADAFKKLLAQAVKLIALIVAFIIETGGKILLWIAKQIKTSAK